ncbi:MAG: hypothetical protein J6386_12265 [Candidatus Synoicihabitans palmerolidicus]|nr:hypothetical protein [Candidatus Synoicihabitans palmerolidicus]
MCRNQEILPVSGSLFLRYLLFANLLCLWNTLHLAPFRPVSARICAGICILFTACSPSPRTTSCLKKLPTNSASSPKS